MAGNQMTDVMRNVDTGRKARNIEPVWDYIEQKYRPENCASRFFLLTDIYDGIF